jgi:hypothetical protein
MYAPRENSLHSHVNSESPPWRGGCLTQSADGVGSATILVLSIHQCLLNLFKPCKHFN